MVCLIDQFLLDSVLEGWRSLESCPFVKNFGILLFTVFSHGFLYFCRIHCDFSFFISYFVWVLSLLWVGLEVLSVLFIFSKKQLLVWLIFSYFFFWISILSISSLIFWFPSFSLLGFVFSFFSIYFVCCVRLSNWDFYSFLRKVFIAVNFPLRNAFSTLHRFQMVVSSLLFASRYFFSFLFDFLIVPLVF